jgi:hypothetical protein
MATGELGSLGHLAGRFFGALWPGGPSAEDERWARAWLLPGEQRLWGQMSGPDRRHAVGVARDAIALLGGDERQMERPVVASALLHDVGKLDSGFGTIARSIVTALALVVGRSRLVAPPPPGASESSWRRRIRRYFTHDAIGADLLREAGSDPMTVRWAEEHHRDPVRWTVDRRVADALKAADGD